MENVNNLFIEFEYSLLLNVLETRAVARCTVLYCKAALEIGEVVELWQMRSVTWYIYSVEI